jgi:DNA-binding NarL/FixJ family response regulator
LRLVFVGNTRFVIHRSMSPEPFSPQPDPAAQPSPTRVLLLVEDNPGDVQLVNELLMDAERDSYEIVHAPLMSTAVDTLRTRPVDVVVLDLRLPDCTGVDTVKAVRDVASEVPIVVLTGSDDEQLAMDCIDAGAQDYLPKAEVRSRNLRRALGYAITRIRDAQVRHLEATLSRYRTLSTASQGTSVTAALAGSGAVAQRHPPVFERLVRGYFGCCNPISRARPTGSKHRRPRWKCSSPNWAMRVAAPATCWTCTWRRWTGPWPCTRTRTRGPSSTNPGCWRCR